jgi:homoaconitate hydratase family protein/3-isopropylmalate dehydratase small subunit
MAHTIIEKIIANHSEGPVNPEEIVDVTIDARLARDFGGASVVKNLKEHGLEIDDADRTFFTFDCNPGGSDQKYAANQQICRQFARASDIQVYDIDSGIGTHLAIDEGLIFPGGTLVSTDSHANIVGAIGAFGQGMGDLDIAYAFAQGKVWFTVPPTIKVTLQGRLPESTTPKDLALFLLKHFGASGLLGSACEIYGRAAEQLDLTGRITVASLATEMGGIIILFPPDEAIIDRFKKSVRKDFTPMFADPDAVYQEEVEVDISNLEPLISRPGHPDDVVTVAEVKGQKIDSAFIGSCTNGRYEDLERAARILKGRKVAPGVVLKIVPATDAIWRRCLQEGLLATFKEAGALVGNAGCAGCAAGQIGQNGPGEVTISTGNRNFPGKQGRGQVWLASPATAAASAIAGHITTEDDIPEEPSLFHVSRDRPKRKAAAKPEERPTRVKGKVWIIDRNNIDTDMIYHNRHLAVTDLQEMGQYAFGNLEGWEDFSEKVEPGDIIVTGRNFGCGSSRQHAVDCFRALKVGALVARSFGAIYERNAINSGLPIMVADLDRLGLHNGDEVEIDFITGQIRKTDTGRIVQGTPFFTVQLSIYQRGGLL